MTNAPLSQSSCFIFIKKFLQSSLLAVVLFAVFPVLQFIAANGSEGLFYIGQTLLILLPCLLLGVLLFAVGYFFFGERHKAALLAAGITFACLGVGSLYSDVIGDMLWHGKRILSRTEFLIILGLVFVATILTLRRLQVSQVKALVFFANIFGCYMLLSSLALIGWHVWHLQSFLNPGTTQTSQHTATNAAETSHQLPDIFYIVPDGYVGQKELQSIGGFDNSEFISALRQEGFYVADKASSNYPRTRYSLASSLNMRYVHENKQDPNFDVLDRSSPYFYGLIQEAEVFTYLKDKGYKIINIGSDRPALSGHIRAADINVSCTDAGELYDNFLQRSIVYLFEPDLELFGLNTYKQRICSFDKFMEASASQVSPKFVFMHVVVPHPPYIFRADGSLSQLPSKVGATKWPKEGYLEQIQHVNTRLLQAVKQIKQHSPDAVIVIQGDHGSAMTFPVDDDRLFELTPERINERFSILNAIRIPESILSKKHFDDKGQLVKFETGTPFYETLSPVNNFRLIFWLVFGDYREILDDRNYFVWNEENPFAEVTAQVRAGHQD